MPFECLFTKQATNSSSKLKPSNYFKLHINTAPDPEQIHARFVPPEGSEGLSMHLRKPMFKLPAITRESPSAQSMEPAARMAGFHYCYLCHGHSMTLSKLVNPTSTC